MRRPPRIAHESQLLKLGYLDGHVHLLAMHHCSSPDYNISAPTSLLMMEVVVENILAVYVYSF